MPLEVLAPAKLNLTLEILGRRPDGFHELVSVMQAIDVADVVSLGDASHIDLQVTGEEQLGVPLEGPRNLAYRAAHELLEEAGRPDLGARIILDKRIPSGMGLGGGSSDAAAVLRGLNRLWRLDFDIETLERIAARVGSDVPFFLHGGTALVRGRGELIEPLPDHEPLQFSLFASEIEIDDKTRRMYAALVPADFGDGHHTDVTAATLRHNLPLTETDMVNAFDARIDEVAPSMAHAMATCREAGVGVHAAGSGPGFFSWTPLADLPRLLLHELEREWGVRARACHSLTREASLSVREL